MFLSGDLSQTSFASDRLTFKAFTATDAPDMFAEMNERIARYMSWNMPTEAEYREVWQRQLEEMTIGFQLSLVVRLVETGEFIGVTSLSPAEGELLETGLWIKEAAHGHGYGRETIAAVCAWGSKTFRASGFLYPVVDENLPSCKLAQSLGAEIIGTRPRQKPGEPARTMLLYRIPAGSRPIG